MNAELPSSERYVNHGGLAALKAEVITILVPFFNVTMPEVPRFVTPEPLPLKTPPSMALVAMSSALLLTVPAWMFAPFTLVNPPPLPLKLPLNAFARLPAVITPLKVFEPVKVWLALSSATLVDRRASAIVPLAKFQALRLVSPVPLPVKVPFRFPLPLKVPLKLMWFQNQQANRLHACAVPAPE